MMRIFEGYQRGVNLGGWLSQCIRYDEEYFDTFTREEDIKQIAAWGFDHVRLPIDYDVIEEEDGTPKEAGHRHIQDCIDWCEKYHLNIVLDLHKSCGFMFDTAAVADSDKFFTDEKLQDRFIQTWTELISRYGRYHDRMAFELLNEVVNPDYKEEWADIADRAIHMIREVQPEAWIILGGVQHNSVVSVPTLRKPLDDHIVYNFHCYEPLCFTHQHAHWVENIDYNLPYPAPLELYVEKSKLLDQNDTAGILSGEVKEVGPEFFENLFRDAIAYAEKQGAPLYCGEYGVIDQADPEDALRWIRDINQVFHKHGIGCAIWNYREKDFGITEAHYDSVRDDVIKALTE
jgi:aryl-phospho-beta-D-glucosidase BglC (GH1 family)